jgi:hypothetical protein
MAARQTEALRPFGDTRTGWHIGVPNLTVAPRLPSIKDFGMRPAKSWDFSTLMIFCCLAAYQELCVNSNATLLPT